MKKMKKYMSALLALLVVSANGIGMAEESAPVWLGVNHSYFYRAYDAPIKRVAVANPAIADVIVIDFTELNIIGKAPGSTTVSVWAEDGTRQDIIVSVSSEDMAMAQHIKQSMGLPEVQVSKVGEKIVLQGKVKDQNEMKKALAVAQLYVSDEKNIVNLVEMKNPTMVNISALVIDITDADAKNLGIQFANAGESSSGSSGGSGSSSTISFGTPGDFFGGMNYQDTIHHPFNNIDFKIQALAKKNKVRVLSRPNITTLSGEEAEILVGGEMGVPTSKDGEISIEWKEYGIHLKIKPTVDSQNKILTKINAEVSDLNPESAYKTTAGVVYGLTSRKANTTVSLPDGTTMAIGGLMNSRQSKIVSKIPILGDIPIIGNFFKHTAKSKDTHELMILVKPTIVTPYDYVKGSQKMADAVEENKREVADMQEIRPNDPPKSVPSKEEGKN